MICKDCGAEFNQKCVELYCKDCLEKRINEGIQKLRNVNENVSAFNKSVLNENIYPKDLE